MKSLIAIITSLLSPIAFAQLPPPGECGYSEDVFGFLNSVGAELIMMGENVTNDEYQIYTSLMVDPTSGNFAVIITNKQTEISCNASTGINAMIFKETSI